MRPNIAFHRQIAELKASLESSTAQLGASGASSKSKLEEANREITILKVRYCSVTAHSFIPCFSPRTEQHCYDAKGIVLGAASHPDTPPLQTANARLEQANEGVTSDLNRLREQVRGNPRIPRSHAARSHPAPRRTPPRLFPPSYLPQHRLALEALEAGMAKTEAVYAEREAALRSELTFLQQEAAAHQFEVTAHTHTPVETGGCGPMPRADAAGRHRHPSSLKNRQAKLGFC